MRRCATPARAPCSSRSSTSAADGRASAAARGSRMRAAPALALASCPARAALSRQVIALARGARLLVRSSQAAATLEP